MLRFLILLLFIINSAWVTKGFAASSSYQEPKPTVIQQQHNQAKQSIDQSEKMIQQGEMQKILSEEQKKINQIPRFQTGLSVNMPDFLQSQHNDRYLYQALTAGQAIEAQQSVVMEKSPIILVSLSMPESQLRSLMAEANKVGAYIAVRGLINDDFKQTIIKLRQLAGAEKNDEQLGGIVIDPTLFRRFSIEAVPAFILPLEPLKLCTADGCIVPQHIQATGSVTLKYFLDLVARTGNKEEKKSASSWLEKFNE